MSKRSLFVAAFAFVLGLAGAVRAEEAAKLSTAAPPECPHMKAMREAQEQGKGGDCPHMRDGKPCDCPHMKDGKPCDCPHHKAAAPKDDQPGKQPAKRGKPAGRKGVKASPEGEAKQ